MYNKTTEMFAITVGELTDWLRNQDPAKTIYLCGVNKFYAHENNDVVSFDTEEFVE